VKQPLHTLPTFGPAWAYPLTSGQMFLLNTLLPALQPPNPPLRHGSTSLTYSSITLLSMANHTCICSNIKIPKHAHPDLYARSFDLWKYGSYFSRLNFSWPNGLINLASYEFYTEMHERLCSICKSIHAFDALSSLAHCRSLAHILALSYEVWPESLQDPDQPTIEPASQTFFRTLLPH